MSAEPQETLENGPGVGADSTPPDSARGLVERMVAAGAWPEPELLEQILAAGEAAVEPLREVLGSRPRGWPDEVPICHAAGLLSMIQPTSALPDLCAAARFYKNDTTESMGNALAAYGRPGLDALIELIRDPSVSGYQRESLIEAGFRAAGSDLELRARLAKAVREVFARVAEEARQAEAFENELLAETPPQDTPIQELDEEEFGQLADESAIESVDTDDLLKAGDDDELDEEQICHMEDCSNEIAPDETLELLALDLAVLADPQGREMIRSAGEAGLVREGEFFPEVVGELYELGGEIYESRPPWLEDYLEDYRESYASQKEYEDRLARLPHVEFPSVVSYPSFERLPPLAAPPVQPVEPFRNAAPRIGRNDPCWCGSGKKYKKCHLGKDTQV